MGLNAKVNVNTDTFIYKNEEIILLAPLLWLISILILGDNIYLYMFSLSALSRLIDVPYIF